MGDAACQAPNAFQPLRLGQLLLQAALRGDVHGDARHAHDSAAGVANGKGAAADPDDAAVRTPDAIGLVVRALPLEWQAGPDALAIVLVDRTDEARGVAIDTLTAA